MCTCICVCETLCQTYTFTSTVNSAWLLDYGKKSPSEVYFCTSKLQVWANVADQAQEAIHTCHELLAPYFEKTHRDIVSQLTGEKVICLSVYVALLHCVAQLTGEKVVCLCVCLALLHCVTQLTGEKVVCLCVCLALLHCVTTDR